MDDEDRVYYFNSKDVVRLVNERGRVSTEIIPTDDPDRYIVRFTAPVPKFLIKSVNYGEQESSN